MEDRKKDMEQGKPEFEPRKALQETEARLAHTIKVRDAAIHDIAYLKGQVDLLRVLAQEVSQTRVSGQDKSLDVEKRLRAAMAPRPKKKQSPAPEAGPAT